MNFTKDIAKEEKESVQDYPLPPQLESTSEPIKIIFKGKVLAETTRAKKCLEKGLPPVYYIPFKDINFDFLQSNDRRTVCEFKGKARYWDLKDGDKLIKNAGWDYVEFIDQFDAIKDHITFYAHTVDACYIGEEKVQAYEGDYYGGWITSKIAGPFKGISKT